MKTSLLICTYNRGSLINNTLKSIFENQSTKPSEVIVVNGGGTNNCKNTLTYWKNKYNYLKVIETKNINLATSRNIGLSQCKGDIILQTDDDAVLFPNWIEKMIAAHVEFPKAGVIGGDVIDASDGSLLFQIADATTFPHYKEIKEVRNVPGVNSSYKKEVIEQIGDYDITLNRGEDVDYNWRVINANWKVVYIPEIKVYHHHRSSWKKLFHQHYMYGKSYYLVREKWPDMYCAYPKKINSLKSFFKFLNYWLQPYLEGLKKGQFVKGIGNKIISYPIIICLLYYWRKGVYDQSKS